MAWLLNIDALTDNTGMHSETTAIFQATLDVNRELLLVLSHFHNRCRQVIITGIKSHHQTTGIRTKINHATIQIRVMSIQLLFQWHHAHKNLIFLNFVQITFINFMVMALIIRMYANNTFTTYSYRSYEHLELLFMFKI